MFAKLNISINEVRKFINALDWSDIRQRDIDEYFNSEKRTSKKVIDDSLLKNNIWDGDGVRGCVRTINKEYNIKYKII